MNSIKKDNLKLLIIENSNSLNNYLDDDVLFSAIKQLERANHPDDIIEAISLIITAIEYRQGSPAHLTREYAGQLRNEFIKDLEEEKAKLWSATDKMSYSWPRFQLKEIDEKIARLTILF